MEKRGKKGEKMEKDGKRWKKGEGRNLGKRGEKKGTNMEKGGGEKRENIMKKMAKGKREREILFVYRRSTGYQMSPSCEVLLHRLPDRN